MVNNMDLQQINIKIFVSEDSQIVYTNFIKVFNRWMEEAEQDDYLNYADYSFTHAGPGVLLISKQANYSIDYSDLQHGFLYNQKHNVSGENQEKIHNSFIKALSLAEKLQSSSELEEQVRFDGNQTLFFINNRNIATNTDKSFELVQEELRPILELMYGNHDFVLSRAYEDPRKRFGIRVSSKSSNGDLSNLLGNLSA